MIDFYFWTTPNGYKVLSFLEETGIPYRIVPVNISKGEQFEPEFLRISPNNKMPAIIDNSPGEPGMPISLFESGAILLYLAEKTGHFLPIVGDTLSAKSPVVRIDFVDDDMCQLRVLSKHFHEEIGNATN